MEPVLAPKNFTVAGQEVKDTKINIPLCIVRYLEQKISLEKYKYQDF